MLQGKELGTAIKAAMKLKKVTQQQVADEFGIFQPSVSAWTRTGRIDKGHLDHLIKYFADVVGPAHWGLTTLTTNYDEAMKQAVERVEREMTANLEGLSLRAISLAKRFDALADDERRRIAYALIDNALQQFESAAQPASPTRKAAPRAAHKLKRPPGSKR